MVIYELVFTRVCAHVQCACVRTCMRACVRACGSQDVSVCCFRVCAETRVCIVAARCVRVPWCISCGHKSLVAPRYSIYTAIYTCVFLVNVCVHIYSSGSVCATTRNTLRTRTSKQTQSNQFARLIDFPSHGQCRARIAERRGYTQSEYRETVQRAVQIQSETLV